MQKRTKELQITRDTKKRVARRDAQDDWPCCVYCGLPAPMDAPLAFSCAHYIARAHGGLGIEQNILTLCPRCHNEYDKTESHEKMKAYFRDYLSEKYEDWQEQDLSYKKEN